MRLPDWMVEAERRQVARINALAAYHKQNPLNRPVRDSYHTAPGWRTKSILFTCVPDPVYPWDPHIVKKLWTFDPTLIPLWVKYVMQPPSDHSNQDTVIIGRHAIGGYKAITESDIPSLPVTMPPMPCQGITLPKPNLIHRIFDSPETNTELAGDLPGDYEPLGDNIYTKMRESYLGTQKSGKQLAREIIEAGKEATAKARAKSEEENDYIQRDLDRFVQKKLDEMSEVELKEALLRTDNKRPRR